MTPERDATLDPGASLSGDVQPPLTRVLPVSGPFALIASLACLRHGGGDPSVRIEPLAADGGEVIWRATRMPSGPVLLRLAAPAGAARARADERPPVRADAWGPGAEAALEALPALLGEHDDACGFRPDPAHPRLVAAHRARPGWRVIRSGNVFESLAAAVIEQKVTGRQAFAGWRDLVLRFGTPAPGPAAQAGSVAAGMRVPPSAADWARIPSWAWLRAGVDSARSRTVMRAAAVADGLERTLDLPLAEVAAALRTVPGIGVWTAAEVRQRAHGDPDAFSWADYHVARNVSWALCGQELDDVGCAELVERYRGHRFRVQRLLELDGAARPRRAPRMSLPTHLPRVPEDRGRRGGRR